MILLSQYGLNSLNEALINNARGSARNLVDFVAEHNFGADLISFDQDHPPLYEPTGYTRPPDFVVQKHGKTYFLQMKKLSVSERDNRRSKVVERITRGLEAIPIGKFFDIALNETFDESDISPLISFITDSISNNPEIDIMVYPSDSNQKAVIELFSSNDRTS